MRHAYLGFRSRLWKCQSHANSLNTIGHSYLVYNNVIKMIKTRTNLGAKSISSIFSFIISFFLYLPYIYSLKSKDYFLQHLFPYQQTPTHSKATEIHQEIPKDMQNAVLCSWWRLLSTKNFLLEKQSFMVLGHWLWPCMLHAEVPCLNHTLARLHSFSLLCPFHSFHIIST